jgi:hypothetical protein
LKKVVLSCPYYGSFTDALRAHFELAINLANVRGLLHQEANNVRVFLGTTEQIEVAVFIEMEFEALHD